MLYCINGVDVEEKEELYDEEVGSEPDGAGGFDDVRTDEDQEFEEQPGGDDYGD
jgi:hypothetical protein